MIDVGDEMTSVVPIYDGFVLRKGKHSCTHGRVLQRANASTHPAAIQKQPTGGALLSNLILSHWKSTNPPTVVTPHYLVKSKEPVGPNLPAKAALRCVSDAATCARNRELTRPSSFSGKSASPTQRILTVLLRLLTTVRRR